MKRQEAIDRGIPGKVFDQLVELARENRPTEVAMTLAETTALIAKARAFRGTKDATALIDELADALQSSLVPMGTVGPQPPPPDQER